MRGIHRRSLEISRLALGVALAAVWAVPGQQGQQVLLQKFAQELQARTVALDAIKTELDRGRALVLSLRKEEEASLRLLRQLDHNIALAQRYQTELGAGIDSLSAGIERLAVSLGGEQRRLAERQEAMKRRLVHMYKVSAYGRASLLQIWEQPVEMLSRALYFRRLKAYDESLVKVISDSRQLIETDKGRLELTRAEQEALLEEQRVQQQRLQAERQTREGVLARLQSERERHDARLSELEAEQKQLLVIISRIESRRATLAADYERALTSRFEQRQGQLSWPLSGEVVGNFGKVVHPVYKTVTMSNGITISTRPGEDVRCVAPGRVAYIGRMRGLGRFLMVDHYGGYLTIYANLGAIAVTQDAEVEYGTVLAQVASAPASPGEPVTLHFELRKSTEALDPMRWLVAGGAR